jgi:replicative superfamily II helicase
MESLSFHLCAEISLGNIKTVEDIKKWYERSFANQVGYEIEIDKVIKNMVKNGYIEEINGETKPTALSDISLKCYFYPNTIVAWRNNFNIIFDSQLEDNVFAISWALANVPNMPIKYNIFKRQDILEEYNDNINSLKLDNEKSLAGIVWWSLMGGMSFSAMKSAKIELKNDYGRINKALKYLNKEYNWNKDDFFDRLDIQINKRVSIELSELCKIKGIGKTHATELFEMGIETIEDVKERLEEIEQFCSEELVKIIKDFKDGLKLS